MSPLGRLIVHPLQQSPRRLVEPVAMRYIAGDRLEDAVRVVRSLNAEKMMATLDLLGEDVSRGEEAELKPLLKAVAQALDKENEGLRLALGTDDFRKALTASAGKRLPAS